MAAKSTGATPVSPVPLDAEHRDKSDEASSFYYTSILFNDICTTSSKHCKHSKHILRIRSQRQPLCIFCICMPHATCHIRATSERASRAKQSRAAEASHHRYNVQSPLSCPMPCPIHSPRARGVCLALLALHIRHTPHAISHADPSDRSVWCFPFLPRSPVERAPARTQAEQHAEHAAQHHVDYVIAPPCG